MSTTIQSLVWGVALCMGLGLSSCAESQPEPTTAPPPRTADAAPDGAASATDTPTEATKMQTADWHALAKQALTAATVPNADGLRLSGGPGWMFDPDATTPFLFYVATGDGGRPGREEAKHCVAINTLTKAVYYKKPEGFQEFIAASGFTGDRAKLDGRQLLETWFVFQHGVPPTVILNPASVKDEALKAFVQVPEARTEGDKTVVVGWTARMRYSFLERHTITIDGEGKVTAVTAAAADVLAAGK